jgi:hypothetical protein
MKMPALSILQPHAEQILRGKKKIEYRNMPTNKRERVYIYASKTPADKEAWNEIGLAPGDLPNGVIVGTVGVVGCRPLDFGLRISDCELNRQRAKG